TKCSETWGTERSSTGAAYLESAVHLGAEPRKRPEHRHLGSLLANHKSERALAASCLHDEHPIAWLRVWDPLRTTAQPTETAPARARRTKRTSMPAQAAPNQPQYLPNTFPIEGDKE